MDKEKFSGVLRTSFADTVEEAKEIIRLKSLYPYSQVLQSLAAKVANDHDNPEKQSLLQHAAVYSSDRSVLKEIMMQRPIQRPEAHPAPPFKESIPSAGPVPHELNPGASAKDDVKELEKNLHTLDLADTIMQDLARLYESKHKFEMLFTDDAAASFIKKDEPLKPRITYQEPLAGTKTKREKIIELSKPTNGNDPKVTSTPKRRKSHHTDHIIEEIKTSKQEIEPESERQKQQIEIIDHFIKAQPTIPPPKEKNLPASDLNSIKSGEFGENIISETLVEILIKQGKKDRAIEVLKKLIWKYPQKKAYFASQIEELKK